MGYDAHTAYAGGQTSERGAMPQGYEGQNRDNALHTHDYVEMVYMCSGETAHQWQQARAMP